MRYKHEFIIVDARGAYLESISQHKNSRTLHWTSNKDHARHYSDRATATRIAERLHANVEELQQGNRDE